MPAEDIAKNIDQVFFGKLRDNEDVETEAQQPVVAVAKRIPRLPSAAKVAAHNFLCEPYRSWCRACIAGRGLSKELHRDRQIQSEVPVVLLDYTFLDEAENANPILFGRDDR